MAKRLRLPAQEEVNTDSQWEALLQTKELIVVDVFSSWCGPCTSMKSVIRKIKQQIGDDVRFALAKSDNIAHLAPFQNKSEPTWLFISGGEIVNIMHGCNSKKLIDLISSELKKEILIQKGEIDRTTVELTSVENEETPLIKPPPELPKDEQKNKKEMFSFPHDDEHLYRPFTVSYE